MYKYYSNSKTWPPKDAEGLRDMLVNATETSREIFFEFVDEEDVYTVEESLEGDEKHVTYYISKLKDEPVYYLKHSNIAYVFKQG